MKGTVVKRGKSWSYIVDKGFDERGVRKQKTKAGFATKKDAQDALAKTINELNEGNYIETNHMTLEYFLTDFLAIKQLDIRSSTMTSYRNVVKNHLIPYFGKKKLQMITANDIYRMYLALQEKNNVSSAMLSEIHKVFSVALKHATLTGIIKHNPISLVKKPKPIKKEMFVWNKEEAKRFLDSIKKERLYPLFHLALSSGMRKSEMLGLRWKDINFSNQTIQVVQTLSNDGKTIFSTTKTKSGKRSISIDENTLNILKVHRNVINSEKELQSDYDDRDLVFATSSGKPTVSSNVTRSFNAYIKSSRSKKIKFHDLRHSFATILLTEGIHPKIVAEMLGHADMRTTLEIYSHVNQNMQRDVADKVGKFFL